MNMIQNAKDQVLELTLAAYRKAAGAGLLPADCPVQPSVEIPKDTANGDYTTTFCLAAAKALRKNPREVAQILLDNMDLAGSYFTSAAMAGPGFLNFTLGTRWFGETVAAVQREGAELLGEFLVRMAGFAVVFIIVFQRRLLRPRRGRKRQQRPQQQSPVQRASHSMKPSCFSHAISRS